MDQLKIGDVARLANIEPSAIRYYESIGLLPAPPRSSGQRRYDASILPRLTMICTARDLGFSLDEIRTLLDGFSADAPPSERWRSLADTKLTEIEAQMAMLERMRLMLQAGLRCECIRIEDCFS